MIHHKSKILIVFSMSLALWQVSCSSSAKRDNSETQPDVVISRMDSLKERPEWLKESEPFLVKDGQVISLGQTTLPGDARVEAGYRIAQNSAKSAVANAIQQQLQFTFQSAEEGSSIDATQARFIGGEASNLVSSSIRPGKVYWEKIAVTQDDGQRVTRYRIFATITMPESDFKRAIMQAIAKANGHGLSADFSEKVNKEWDKLVQAPQPNQSAEIKK